MPNNDKANNYRARPPKDFESQIFTTLTKIDKKVDSVQKAVEKDRVDMQSLIRYTGTNRMMIVITLCLTVIGFMVVFSIIGQLL